MLGMKIKEYNSKTVIISNKAPLWLLALCVVLGVFFSFGPTTFPEHNCTGHCMGCYCLNVGTLLFVVAASYFLIAPGIETITTFDIVSNCIIYRIKLYGFQFRQVVMPIHKTKYQGVIKHTRYTDSYRLYLKNYNGKRYGIGVFFSMDDYDEFVEKLQRFVPIPRPGPIQDNPGKFWPFS